MSVPAAIVLATAFAVAASPSLPYSLSGLTRVGPYVVLGPDVFVGDGARIFMRRRSRHLGVLNPCARPAWVA